MVMGALALGLFSSWRNNRAIEARAAEVEASMSVLEDENARLRAEQGELTIDDERKVYAIRLPDLPKNTWAYRVYLPPGDTYFVAESVNGLPTGTYEPLRLAHPPPSTISSRTYFSGDAKIYCRGLEPGKE